MRPRASRVALRFADGAESGFALDSEMLEPSPNGVFCPQRGMARLDAREVVRATDGSEMVFHRGGWGFAGDDPASAVHFGHVRVAELDTTGLEYLRADTLAGETRGRWVPAATRTWAGPGQSQGNGSACGQRSPTPLHVVVQSIPGDMRYLNTRQTNAIPYAIYGNPAGDLGVATDRARGVRYSMLTWSWINARGGGVARALLRDGQEFFPCTDVPVIQLASVAEHERKDVTGWVAAVYGAIASGDGKWMYGWTVYAHRHRDEGVVQHMRP
ncbi:MAG: hypothetical protein ABIY52_05900 [Gemmatimonadaceae bacterium]